jgi:2-hydroxychromene-2-carboxylate isomerase
MNKVEFYFDFISPYSFFAWKNITAENSPFKNYSFEFLPTPLGPLLNHWGLVGPGVIEPKRDYLLKNCFRYAKKKNWLFGPPKIHPFNSLYALRLSLLSVAGDSQKAVIEALWELGWVRRDDLSHPDILVKWLRDKNLPADELYEKSFSKEAKAELKQNLTKAIARKVFGVPSFFYEGESFWGNDSLDDLLSWLSGDRGYDSASFQEVLAHTQRGAQQSIS